MAVFQLPDFASISLGQTVISLCLVLISTFVIRLVRHRLSWRVQDLPGPPHSFLWGHFREFIREQKALGLPPDAAMTDVRTVLTRKYGTVVYLDLWPFTTPHCIVAKASVADKILRTDNLPKFQTLYKGIMPVVGEKSLLVAGSSKDAHREWQRIRQSMSPSFAKGTLEREHTATVIADVRQAITELEQVSRTGDIVKMTQFLTDITLDIILNVTLGISDRAFRERVGALLTAQVDQVANSHGLLPLIDKYNPVRRYMEWKRTREMNGVLHGSVQQHIVASSVDDHTSDDKGDILQATLEKNPLDFKNAIAQVKTLIFGGHDTTSNSLAWTYYILSTNNEVLRKLRDEHDTVFGPASVGKEDIQILESPAILNKLYYTNAVIKETLRLYAPANAARHSPDPTYTIKTDIGPRPLHSCMAVLDFAVIHRHPDNFEDPDAFKPERWLTAEGTAAGTPVAWQPFSRGPKNCVGLELALLEQRILLAMTVRKFEFEYAALEPPYTAFHLTKRASNLVPLKVRLSEQQSRT